MADFETLFIASRGKPVAYGGRELHMVDLVPCTDGERFRLAFESARSNWRQGVMFDAAGTLEVLGQVIEGPVVLWQDTAPATVDIVVRAHKGPMQVKNVWQTGDGVVHSWHNGAAMVIEPLPAGRRYRCNDGHPDEDFDDLVFRLERQES